MNTPGRSPSDDFSPGPRRRKLPGHLGRRERANAAHRADRLLRDMDLDAPAPRDLSGDILARVHAARPFLSPRERLGFRIARAAAISLASAAIILAATVHFSLPRGVFAPPTPTPIATLVNSAATDLARPIQGLERVSQRFAAQVTPVFNPATNAPPSVSLIARATPQPTPPGSPATQLPDTPSSVVLSLASAGDRSAFLGPASAGLLASSRQWTQAAARLTPWRPTGTPSGFDGRDEALEAMLLGGTAPGLADPR